MGQKLIRTFFKEHKWSYIAGLIFMLGASYIQTLFPKVLGDTIDILSRPNFSFASVRLNILYILLIAAGTFFNHILLEEPRNRKCKDTGMLHKREAL